MYEYRILDTLRVVDGDTIDVRISLGFGLTAALRVRLACVDTYELYGRHADERGRAAADFTHDWLQRHADDLLLRTFKGSTETVGIGDGSFGRWLGSIYTVDGLDLAAALRDAGHSPTA